jgi:hypothetical protein
MRSEVFTVGDGLGTEPLGYKVMYVCDTAVSENITLWWQ